MDDATKLDPHLLYHTLHTKDSEDVKLKLGESYEIVAAMPDNEKGCMVLLIINEGTTHFIETCSNLYTECMELLGDYEHLVEW